jgi:hypothetical protein
MEGPERYLADQILKEPSQGLCPSWPVPDVIAL